MDTMRGLEHYLPDGGGGNSGRPDFDKGRGGGGDRSGGNDDYDGDHFEGGGSGGGPNNTTNPAAYFANSSGGGARSSPRSQLAALAPPGASHFDPNSTERFSRKVFVGGLPPDIDEGRNIKEGKILSILIVVYV